MRSIFTKILLWAIGTTIVSLVGFAMTTRLIWESMPGPGDFFARTHRLEVEGAREAFEEGGKDRLKAYLHRLDLIFEAKHSLIDNHGLDLVTGEDRTDLLGEPGKAPSLWPGPPRRIGKVFVLNTPESGGYRLVIRFPDRFNPVGMLPYYLWIFLLIAALGYALSVYLGKPLHALRLAVERFGQGDLGARSGSTRRDEIGELARAFDLMAERTETLMTSQKRLLQDVSHELRSPLSRLQLAVRLARTNGDREGALDRIKKEVDRLSTLVDELLKVTALEDDAQAGDRDEIALDDLLKGVVEDEAIEAEAKTCQIQIVKLDPAIVVGDRELLHRALENVLRNATRHSPENAMVDVGLEQVNGHATITIRDFGPGVPDDSLKAIFEPFYRVGDDRSRIGGGVGLGLAITRRAITLHHGEIEARNASPGLAVTIKLPANPMTVES